MRAALGAQGSVQLIRFIFVSKKTKMRKNPRGARRRRAAPPQAADSRCTKLNAIFGSAVLPLTSRKKNKKSNASARQYLAPVNVFFLIDDEHLPMTWSTWTLECSH